MMTDDELQACWDMTTMATDADYALLKTRIGLLVAEVRRGREKVAELQAEVNRLQVIVNRITGPVGGIG